MPQLLLTFGSIAAPRNTIERDRSPSLALTHRDTRTAQKDPTDTPQTPKQVQATAQKITVRVTSATNGGSGVIVARKGSTYLVLTNKHVIGRDRQFQLQTPDGRKHPARLVPNTKIDPNYDLALLQFTSSQKYDLAKLEDGSTLDENQPRPIYSVGYPYDSTRTRISIGKVTQLSDVPLQDGTQIGYQLEQNSPEIKQGMSGGPIVDGRGVLLGINTIGSYPILASYTYVDGSKPIAKLAARYRQANWGVPIYNFLTQLNPDILSSYENFPKVQHQVTPTGYMAKLNRLTRQQTVRIETGNGHGSGVIVARDGNTYSVLTAKHVVVDLDGTKQLYPTIKTITFDQNSYPIEPTNITLAVGQDLAIIKFTTSTSLSASSTINYPVAQLSNSNPKEDDLVFAGGFPGRSRINSPLWQWQLNPGSIYDKDRGKFRTQNLDSFDNGYDLIYTSITYGGMSGGPLFDTEGRVIGLHGKAEGDKNKDLTSGNSLGISIKSFVAIASKLKVNPSSLKIAQNSPPELRSSDLATVTAVRDSLAKPADRQDGRQWHEYGNQLTRTKQYSTAIAAFDRAIEIEPQTYKLYGNYGKARAYAGLKNYQGAISAISTAIVNIPKSQEQDYYYLWAYKSAYLEQIDRHNEAFQANERAIEFRRDDRLLFSTQATLLGSQRKYQQSIATFDKLIGQQPEDYLYYKRGYSKYRAGDLKGALLDYNASLSLNPGLSMAYFFRAGTKEELGDLRGAMSDFDMAISLDSKPISAYHNRGILKATRLNDYGGAISDLNKAIAIVPKDSSHYHTRGLIKKSSGDVKGAIADETIAIDLDPKDIYYYCQRGDFKSLVGDTVGAAADYRSVLRIDNTGGNLDAANPQDFNYYACRGNAKRGLGDLKNAIADYERSIDYVSNKSGMSPNKTATVSTSLYEIRGIIKDQLGDFRGAISDYDRAIAIAPKDSNHYISRGSAKASLKDFKSAISDYNIAINLAPKESMSYSLRGAAKAGLKDFTGAITDYNIAISLAPKESISYSRRGEAKSQLGDIKGAIADHDLAIALEPKNTKYQLIRANTKFKSGDFNGAISDCDLIINIEPKNTLAYVIKGNSKSKLGDLKGAVMNYDRALAIDPKNDIARAIRGITKFQLGDYPGAIIDFDRTIAINSQDDNMYNLRGTAKSQLGDYPGAIGDLDRVISINPKVDTYINRGWYRFLVNNNQGALDDWERAIALKPNSNAYNNRGFYKVVLGYNRAGLIDLERAIVLDPKLADSYAIRGFIRASMGDKIGATSDYQQALKLNPKIVAEWTKDAKQLQRSNNLAAYQKYQQIIQALTAR